MSRPRAIFLLANDSLPLIYGPDEIRDISERVELIAKPQTRESIAQQPAILREVEIIFSGWGMPLLDDEFLNRAPNLRAVFYGAGATGYFITPLVWDRNIRVSCAMAANSIPVAEYTLAMILLSTKHTWTLNRQTLAQRTFPPRDGAPGNYKTTIGLVSLGTIGRILAKMLAPFDLKVTAWDPYVTRAEAASLGVELLPSLDDIFSRSQVVSLHTPLLEETRGMISEKHFRLMRPGATFINTARGPIVRETEMIKVLQERPDLQAILDVTCEEPPANSSPLYTMQNVFLTPHIAGSVGPECRRMGRCMVEELDRYLTGQPLKWEVTREASEHSAHRPTLTVFAKAPAHKRTAVAATPGAAG